ncbi:MAG: biotin synthase, partial [Gorillibacterium sp.]|nr:biotin synthase [Gorillibacterium sp.]
LLPSIDSKPPLLREHRLYQADWLLRFYGFQAKELLDEQNQNFNPLIDPKCNWAIHHMELFPIEINKAPYEMLLRVPGVGVKSAQRIVKARRSGSLDFSGLKKLGVVLKRAQYFITCRDKGLEGLRVNQDSLLRALVSDNGMRKLPQLSRVEQLSFFDEPALSREDVVQCLTGQI